MCDIYYFQGLDNLHIRFLDDFQSAMNEDFNTPVAMVEFNKLGKIITRELNSKNIEIIKELNFMIDRLGGDVLGLEFGGVSDKKEESIPAEVIEKAKLRWEAKQNKDWPTADKYRNELMELGYVIVDSKDGYKLEKK